MNYKFTIKPNDASWKVYKQHKNLIDFIWENCGLKENDEGEWSYMNFTSNSSIWEFDIDDDTVGAVISIEYLDAKCEKIRDFNISINKQIYDQDIIQILLTKFKTLFSLKIEHTGTGTS